MTPTSASSPARSAGVLANRSSARTSRTRPSRSPKRPSAPTTPAPRSCTSTRATTTARPRSARRSSRRSRRRSRKRCPILLNFSTGTIVDDVTEQCAYIRESRPEIAALNMGTMNYSKYSAKRKAFVFDMVFPNTYGKIIKLLDGHERGRREARARVLRHRAHPGRVAAPRHGHAEAAAPVLVHRQRARRHPADGREPAAADEARSCRAGSEWEVIGISEVPVADAGDGAGARRQHPRAGSRTTSTCPTRRDGEEQRRARRGGGAHGARRGAQAGDGRASARHPRPRAASA